MRAGAGCASRARSTQGTVETVNGITTFTISFDGATLPVRYEGQPGGIFEECQPVVVHGELVDGTFEGDASRSSTPTSTRPRTPTASTPGRRGVRARARRQPERRARPGRADADAWPSATFGAMATVYGIRRGDRRMLRMAPRYAWLCVAGAVLADRDDAAGADHPRLLAGLRPAGRLATARRRCTTSPPCGRPSRARSCCGSSILAGYTAAVGWRFRRRTDDPLVGWALVVMFVVMAFFALLSFGPADPFAVAPSSGRPTARAQPAAAEPRPRAVPPADPVPRLRRLHRAVRLRHRRPDHRSGRRGLADGDPPLGAVLVGVPHDRHPARRLVELRGARLERRVGVGPGRERQLPAVADRHRLHPLGARPGAAGDAAGLEPQPARGHVLADDPRHVPHPLRRAVERPRLRRRAGRQLPARRSSASSSPCRWR